MSNTCNLPGFIPIALSLREHLERGEMTPFDAGIYLALHFNCDPETAVCDANAQSIMWMLGGNRLFGAGGNEALKKINISLARLRERGHISYEKDGSGKPYPIRINDHFAFKKEQA